MHAPRASSRLLGVKHVSGPLLDFGGKHICFKLISCNSTHFAMGHKENVAVLVQVLCNSALFVMALYIASEFISRFLFFYTILILIIALSGRKCKLNISLYM
jgi:hypothetical protein